MSTGSTKKRDYSARWWRRAAEIWRRSSRKRYLRKLEGLVRRGVNPLARSTVGNSRAIGEMAYRHFKTIKASVSR